MEQKEISYQDWIETYKPIKNLDDQGMNYTSVSGEHEYGAFDNYREPDRSILNETSPLNIWTLVNEDNHDYLLNGIHWINRMEYYICEVPFVEGEDIVIDMGCCCDEEQEEECEDCE